MDRLEWRCILDARKKRNTATLLSSRMLYTGRVFGVRRDRVIEPGGVEATRDVVVHPGSVVVMPVFPGGRILLIQQYRHSVGQYLWELVAGRIDRGESPLVAARRELAEETGYTALHFRKLMDVFPTPGFVTERMAVFAAEGPREGRARPEDDERITSRIFRLREVEQWIRSGKIRDAKSVAAILYYLRFCR